MAPILEMRGICKAFPGVVALADVDLALAPGRVHMLLGENGAGKSTLMKILSGAYRMDAGQIRVAGQRASIETPRDAMALGIRIIYQELTLVPQLSVAENVYLGALPSRRGLVDRTRLHADACTLLADLGVAIDPRTLVDRLGLAQRQMVEIAKALAGDAAKILVMDEPTSALTTKEVAQLFALIERLTARGVAIVYITHRLDEVFRIGHTISVLRDGRHVRTCAVDEVTAPELVRLMANRDVSDQFPKAAAPRGAERLRVEHLTRRGVLTDVSFTVHAGEVVGVAGLMGAGRTELARALFGADPYDEGRVFVEGRAVRFRTPADAIAHGIGFLPEDRKAHGLVAGLSVARNIALPHGRTLARFLGVLPRTCERDLAAPIREDLRVKAAPAQAVRLLSGGNQQKVVLGKWLAGDVRLFIFDEPTRGIDVGSKVEIYALINRLAARGAGILMISSELPELLGMSDRILVMRGGRMRAELERSEFSEARVLGAALGLDGAVAS